MRASQHLLRFTQIPLLQSRQLSPHSPWDGRLIGYSRLRQPSRLNIFAAARNFNPLAKLSVVPSLTRMLTTSKTLTTRGFFRFFLNQVRCEANNLKSHRFIDYTVSNGAAVRKESLKEGLFLLSLSLSIYIIL